MSRLQLETPRLLLVASTAADAGAAVQGNGPLAAALGVKVPEAWPPETLADVQAFFASRLAADPSRVGWWGWYVIAKPGVCGPDEVLVGSTGMSPPDEHGRCLGGYAILPSYEGLGLTTEAAREVFGWVSRQPGVRVLEAETFERHAASRRILEKLGFSLVGPSPNDESAAESDRQGRGTLLLYRRPIAECS